MAETASSQVVLVVDDEREVRTTCHRALTRAGLQVLEAPNAEGALRLLKVEQVDLLLTDVFMEPGMSGIDLIQRARGINPDLPIFIMSGRSDISTAVQAMKHGADDFLEKPFANLEILILGIKKALRTQKLVRENQLLRDAIQSKPMLIGTAPSMRRLRQLIERVAPLRSTVLLTGETGTGKEVAARMIHELSPRGEKRFLAVNCASFQETLLESSLFGYEKGAFTGALRRTKGVFEDADGGTLLLDEIGDMPMGLQAKLLRVLQEQTFQRLGSTQEVEVDVRVLASTNRDLKADVEQGRFRQDLYYRLNVIQLMVPPLRERPEDVGPLVTHFIHRHNLRLNRRIRGITPAAVQSLLSQDWPGNVRELENLIERAVALAEGDLLTPRDLDPNALLSTLEPASGEESVPADLTSEDLIQLKFGEAKAGFERRYLVQLLGRAGGNVTQASRLSGIPRQNLYQKIKKYDLVVEQFRG